MSVVVAGSFGRVRVRSLRLAAALLCALQVGDVLSTRAVLAAGAVEANPLAHALMLGGWLVVAKFGLSALFLGRCSRLRHAVSSGVLCASWAAVGFYVVAVLGNLLVLLALR